MMGRREGGSQGHRPTAKIFGIIRHVPNTHDDAWDETDSSLNDDGDPSCLEIVGDETPYPDHRHCG